MKILRNYLRYFFIKIRVFYLNRIWGHIIHPTSIVSFSAYLDRTKPELIDIGEKTIIARGAMVLSHDYSRGKSAKVSIGRNCMIGANAIILPGVVIGDYVVVGSGAVVTKDISSNSIAVGNPAKVVKKVVTGPYGRIISEDRDEISA